MASGKNQMRRGVHQALYKYLPGSWADFTTGGGSVNYAVHVDRWNSIPLQDINPKRLLRVVSRHVNAFQSASPDGAAALVDFSAQINEDTYYVLTPKAGGEERAVVTSVNPLLFVCSSCGKVERYADKDAFRHRRSDLCVCGKPMIQIKFIRFCKCGYADGLPMPQCRNREHGGRYVVRRGSGIDFVCSKCGQRATFSFYCPECKEKLEIKPALDSAHYFPFTFSLIDLLDQRKDAFLDAQEEQRGEKIILGQYLGLITQGEYQDIIAKGRIPQSAEFEHDLREEEESLRSGGLPEDLIAQVLEVKRRQDPSGKIYEAIARVEQGLSLQNADEIKPLAEEILEYDELVHAKEVLSLAQAEADAESIRDGIRPDYISLSKAMGFSNVQICSGVPVVFAAYGYTRKERECTAGVKLRGFPQEMDKKNIYANRLETEGVLFEPDRVRVLEWLLQNRLIAPEDAPQERSDEQLKMWFLDRVSLALIEPFAEVDAHARGGAVTNRVYALLHSIAHALIHEAAEICGLDKSSLAEYLMPNIPAIFIYCSNAQGFNMGALYSAFQGHFDRWLRHAAERSMHCIFDPICMDREKACAGCLFLNEVSCQHFNKDLDRGYLCGRFDPETQEKLTGFWEVP